MFNDMRVVINTPIFPPEAEPLFDMENFDLGLVFTEILHVYKGNKPFADYLSIYNSIWMKYTWREIMAVQHIPHVIYRYITRQVENSTAYPIFKSAKFYGLEYTPDSLILHLGYPDESYLSTSDF